MAIRIAFIGCVELSYAVLNRFIGVTDIDIAGVVTRDRSPINADFMSLEPLARHAGCPVLFVERNDQAGILEFMHVVSPQLIICVGWSYLLAPELLTAAPQGIIGYHPAALPRNRGRHPLIWALALGLEQTGSTFFFMDEGADSGPIISQRVIAITPDDDAATLYAKMTETALSQLDELVPALISGQITRRFQDETSASSWRKRGRADGRIDWRMPASAIINLVRALTHPYPGAHCEISSGDIIVWRATVGPDAPADIEPGRVLAVNQREILVKCHDRSVWLIEHEFEPMPEIDTCLLPLEKR